jgi:hypothetical protein
MVRLIVLLADVATRSGRFMIADAWVWPFWSAAFLAPWAVLYALMRRERRIMLRASLLTAPLGLTEPLFVPEYWNPPSLFGLAQQTGFDIESVLFCFGLGGVGAVLYNAIARRTFEAVPLEERCHSRHRHHWLAPVTPLLVFPALFPGGWNPIYPAIIAMLTGAAANVTCRPDLLGKTVIGGALFLAYYSLLFIVFQASAPGYVEQIWNWGAISGVRVKGIPIEELLFAGAFGCYWSGAYEHIFWTHSARTSTVHSARLHVQAAEEPHYG